MEPASVGLVFEAMKWGVAFPLLLVAWGALVWAVLDVAFESDFNTIAWVLVAVGLSVSFVALAAGYMLRGRDTA